MSGKSRLGWRLLYCLGLLIFLEVVARFGLALITKTWEPVVPPEVGAFDPSLGWKLKPGACATSKRTGREVEYCINDKGLRGKELAYEKKPGVFRIVLLGDSRTFGFGVPVEQHFSTVVKDYFRRLEVVNLGIDGYGIDQELLLLQDEGFKYAPDLVLVYVPHFHNFRHMRTKVWGMGKPRFKLAGGKLEVENSPVTNTGQAFAALRSVDQTLSRWWKTYKIFRDTILFVADEDGPIRKFFQGNKEDTDIETPEFQQEAQQLAEAILEAMNAACKARNAKLVLLTAIERLYKAALEQSIPALNVTTCLDNVAFRLPDRLAHFNEAGNGALAWDISTFLTANDLIPAGHLRKKNEFSYPEKKPEQDAAPQHP